MMKREKEQMRSQIASMQEEKNANNKTIEKGPANVHQNRRQVKQITQKKHQDGSRPNNLPTQIDIDALFANSMKASDNAKRILFDDAPAINIGAT